MSIGRVGALLAACLGLAALPGLAITTPEPISPPVLSAPQNTSGSYQVSWSGGFEEIQLYESANGTTGWSLKYSGDAAVASKSFDYDYGGIRYYRARGCASINGNLPSCSEFSAPISVNLAGGLAKPATAIVLGDGYASGEAGRWLGNSYSDPLDEDEDLHENWGTDAPGAGYTEDGYTNGCNRSFSAPIHRFSEPYFPIPPLMIDGPLQKTINLACSRAANRNLWPVAHGGVGLKGEGPQITQIADLTLSHDIKVIALNVGAVDIGINWALMDCIKAWAVKAQPLTGDGEIAGHEGEECHTHVRNRLDTSLWDTYGETAKTINLIRQEMLRQGKTDPEDYRIVLMGYPSIIAGFYDNRYENNNLHRLYYGRCTFNGPDSEFVNETMMTKVNGMFEAVAHDEGIDFINTRDLLDGHKLCQNGSERASFSTAPTADNMEWVRYIDSLFTDGSYKYFEDNWVAAAEPLKIRQGRIQESLYPNQYGQMALGNCLKNWWLQRSEFPAPYRCTNPNPDTTEQVKVARLPFPVSKSVSSDSAIPDGSSTEYGELRLPIIAPELPDGMEEPGGMARVRLKIDHPSRGDLAVYIRDPHGGYWEIKGDNPSDHNPFPPQWTMYLPNTKYVPGEWQLMIWDTRGGNTGTFRDFDIFWY